MSKITPLHYKKLVKVLKKKGCYFIRQKGDHLIYHKEGIKRPLIVPAYSDIPVFIILNLIRTAKISRERFLRNLKKV